MNNNGIYKNYKRLENNYNKIKNQCNELKNNYNQIKNNLKNSCNSLNNNYNQLQNSLYYRISRLFTYQLSILLDFYRFIRDYNLIKKSGLFDNEYYLANNEDVKKAKMNPIKHYLKFGWKEGRNHSSEFD